MNSSDQQQEWKDKYLSALDKCDATETRLKEAEELLNLSIARLSVAASGSDNLLDEQLDKLKRISKKKPTSAALIPLLEQISLSIKRMELELQAGHTHRLPANAIFAKALTRIEFPDQLRKSSRKLISSLKKESALAKMEEHLNSFAELLDSAIRIQSDTRNTHPHKTETPSVNKDESQQINPFDAQQSLLEKMADELDYLRESDGKISFDETAKKAFHKDVRSAKTEKELLKTAKDLFLVISANTESLATENLSRSNALGDIRTREDTKASVTPEGLGDKTKRNSEIRTNSSNESPTESLFLTLLEMLPIPEELGSDAKEISAILRNPNVEKNWESLLGGISNLVGKMQSNLEKERSELQAFLEQLTNQLNEIDSSLIGTEKHQTASFEDGKKLDDKLRNNLASLKTSLDSESSLASLRDVIDSKVESISSYLEAFRSAEDDRRESITQEMRTLRSRLTQMESQTSDLQEKLAEERKQARTDRLTGLNNRMAYEQILEEMYAEWLQGETSLAVIVCDIDHFKKINDTYGHQAGDRALQSIARILKLNVPQKDVLARFGGEEFVVLVADADASHIHAIAERLRSEVEKASFRFQGKQIPITISCGYSSFTADDEPSTAFRRADEFLYEAKKRGRNRCVGDDN